MTPIQTNQIKEELSDGITRPRATELWDSFGWKHVEEWVLKLQKQIFQATIIDDIQTAQRLALTLQESPEARIIAIRKVTEKSKGKNTPGVDGVATLSDLQKLELLFKLDLDARPRSARSCQIPKGDGKGTRELGIPTIRDRVLQEICRMALDPIIEVMFVQSKLDAYGFRPGKSREDAIHACRNYIDKGGLKFVAECDIEKFFDKASHQAIFNAVDSLPIPPKMKRYIKRALKAGSIRDGEKTDRIAGTPQGGPVSGTLANLILFGLEPYIQDRFPKTKVVGGKRINWTPAIIRYADDIRIIHPDRAIIEECIVYLDEFLKSLGLNLNLDKTHIRSSRDGFDFLGYTVRQYVRDPMQRKTRRPYVTLVTPSKRSIQRHYSELGQIVNRHKSCTQEELIKTLNPKIKGWAYAYTRVNASKAFSKLEHLLFYKLMRWTKRRHNNKSKVFIIDKYFNGGKPWKFISRGKGDKPDVELELHSRIKAKRKSKSPKAYSVYDSTYNWKRKDTALARKYEADHADISQAWEALRKESSYIHEEPCEVKVSCTVLKTSRAGDSMA